ncbi:nucleotide disphospho-sugar-binding domain-containing protein [Paenibacillus ihumii]|uniref:nucleotide disphospho-sugar-binding domain-containing protein n=1 Tax=Paenibacillus ihumii TaxID=687436 RepID=UPI0006D777D3|nr:nucleotide disphospho-sugar-binding domain-containing protein [Paenibacillus ihumii]
MKLLFFMLPYYGHINPTLSTAEELVRRGEQIVYYTTEEFAGKVASIGAEIRLVGREFGFLMDELGEKPLTASLRDGEFYVSNLNRHIALASELLDLVRLEKADGVVCDPMCLWGRTVAEKLGLPRALFCSGIAVTADSAVFEYFSRMFDGKIPEIVTSMFLKREPLMLAPIPREFQPDAEDLEEAFEFIGPTIVDRESDTGFPLEEIAGHPTLYISLGSVINNPRFYELCIKAFAGSRWKVVMVAKTPPPEIPANFSIYPFVPQLKVLQHADLFISHGGMNSVMESLWYGVPLLMVPQSSDQPLVAARAEELNLGRKMDLEAVTPELLLQKAEEILADPVIRSSVQSMQSILHHGGGGRRGAEVLQRYFAAKPVGEAAASSMKHS